MCLPCFGRKCRGLIFKEIAKMWMSERLVGVICGSTIIQLQPLYNTACDRYRFIMKFSSNAQTINTKTFWTILLSNILSKIYIILIYQSKHIGKSFHLLMNASKMFLITLFKWTLCINDLFLFNVIFSNLNVFSERKFNLNLSLSGNFFFFFGIDLNFA